MSGGYSYFTKAGRRLGKNYFSSFADAKHHAFALARREDTSIKVYVEGDDDPGFNRFIVSPSGSFWWGHTL